MLISLHTGLLAVVHAAAATSEQQQQQAAAVSDPQRKQQQQQQHVLPPPGSLLCSVLRVLCALVAVTPYERLPGHLLSDVADAAWQLWQQQGAAEGGAAAGSSSKAVDYEESSSVSTAAVAVLAQALSTRKPSAGIAAWLNNNIATAAAAGGGGWAAAKAGQQVCRQQKQEQNMTDTSAGAAGVTVPVLNLISHIGCSTQAIHQLGYGFQGGSGSLVLMLLAAAGSTAALLRIEALAALRGCCINYHQAVAAAATAAATAEADIKLDSQLQSSSSSSSSVGSCWPAVVSAVQYSIAASQQIPRSPRGTPVGSSSSNSIGTAAAFGSGGSKTGTAGSSSAEVSASTSPEDKAAQHAVKLLGDWLSACWKAGIGSEEPGAAASAAVAVPPGGSSMGASATAHAAANGQQPGTAHSTARQQQQLEVLTGMWGEALSLLLSEQLQQHPSYMIRSAAAAVAAGMPAAVWQLLPAAQQQRLLEAMAAAAQGDSVPAARAAACKVLGSLLQLPGVLTVARQVSCATAEAAGLPLQQEKQQQQQQYQEVVLLPLARCARDTAVSVRLNASWAIANACDVLKSQSDAITAGENSGNSNEGGSTGAAAVQVSAAVLQHLCEPALAAAGDSEKVRANGIRAVGALLAAWRPEWGMASSSNSSSSSTAYAGVQPADWSWLPGWLRNAVGQLQSCLASRSPKVVWNAAYAAAGLLQNSCIHGAPEVRPTQACYSVGTHTLGPFVAVWLFL